MRLLLIEWLDPHSADEWQDEVLTEPIFCRSVGWLLHEDEKVLTLAATLGSHEQHFAQLCLPKGCITRRLELMQ